MATHFTPDDVVPSLRSDLDLKSAPTGTGAEVIDVRPAGAVLATPMHGFEFSIALMLDGRRTANDVLVNCTRLGLPLSLEALDAFVAQLDTQGLISAGTTPARPVRTWSPPMRELFRSALRRARQGDSDAADDELNQLLTLAPGTSEAVQLKTWLAARAMPSERADDFQVLLRGVQDSWSGITQLPPGRRERALAWVRARRSPIAGVAVVAGIMLVSMLTSMPRVTRATAVLTPIADVPVLAPETGVVGKVRVQNGDRVEAGAVLFTWSVDDLQLALLDATERLDAARVLARDETAQLPAVTPLLADLERAEWNLGRAQAQLLTEQKENLGSDPMVELSRGELRFAHAHNAVEEAEGALDALAAPSSVRWWQLDALGARVRELRARLGTRWVTAEVGGVVSGLAVRSGQSVSEGDHLMRLEDRDRLSVVATMTEREGRTYRRSEAVTMNFDGVRAIAQVEQLSPGQFEGELANPAGTLKPGVQPVGVERPARALMELLREKTGFWR